MPVTFTRDQIESVEATSNGTLVPLTQEQKDSVVFYRFVANDADLTDYFPGDPWKIQIGADIPLSNGRTRLNFVDESGEERGISGDDGLTMNLEGRPAGSYAWDTQTNRFLSEEESEIVEETNDVLLPRSERWAFRITELFLTDGPLQREMKFRTEEQRSEIAKEGMFEAIGQAVALAFQHGASNMAAAGESSPDPDAMLKSVDMTALMEEVQARMQADGENVSEEEVRDRVLDAQDMTANASPTAALEEEDIEVDSDKNAISELLAG